MPQGLSTCYRVAGQPFVMTVSLAVNTQAWWLPFPGGFCHTIGTGTSLADLLHVCTVSFFFKHIFQMLQGGYS